MIGPIEEPAKTPRVLVTGKAVLAIFFTLFEFCVVKIGLIFFSLYLYIVFILNMISL